MEKERPGTMIYFDLLPIVQCLSKEAVGNLFIAILEYGKDGKIPDFGKSEGLNVAWIYAKQMIDRDKERYSGKILRNAYGLYKRESNRREEEPLSFDAWYQQVYLPAQGAKRPDAPPPMETVPPPVEASTLPAAEQAAPAAREKRGSNSGFVPPTLAEVRAYCEERKNGVDPDRFIDFYASKGWKVGNQKMKDWRACVRTWERRSGTAQYGGNQNAAPFEYRPGDTSGSL